ESWNAQEKLLVEQSNRRLEHYAQQADERGVRVSHARKRRRQDDTESSSDDETSIDDSIQFNDELSECNLQIAEMGIGKTDLTGKPQDEAKFAESRERVKELEEELADQRDLIENLSRDRDHLRVEINRLEFASAQLQRQLEAERTASAKKVSQDSASQTDLLMRDMNGDVGQGFADQSISKSTIQHSLFEDSEIVVRLPKSKDPTNALKGGRKFFDSSVSPEQAQRLVPTSSSWCDSDKAPNTVIRMPAKPAVDRGGFGEHIEVIKKADGLREENQMLFARLAQTKTCAQKTIQQKHDAELEFTRLHAVSVLDESKNVRMSEGLQSFLENESRLQQMETVEQLQQQVYELEEQFASKHDALLRLEMAYERLLNEKEELTQRLLSQVDKIARLGHEIADLQTNHQDELHTLQVKEKQARELALAKFREEFESRLLEEQSRLASLQNRAPDQDVSVQVGAIETLLDTSVQTIAQEQIKSADVSLQVSLCTLSVGSQTEPLTPKTPGLGSPILPVRSSADVDEHFKKPACRRTNTSNIDADATLDQTTTASRALRSGTQRSLRLRYQDSRQTKPHNKGLYSFKLPSPVSLQPFTSDSESDTETVSTEEDKENRGRTTHHSKETTDEEDAKSCSSEPVRQIKKQTGPARRARSGSRPIPTDKPEQSLSTRARFTRSVAATRRLPPLAESTQLMPDSFFQDELDAALDHVDAEENRRQLRPQLRQKLRRRR
ncbi:kinesin family member 20, partial [Paragonimus westermani]